MRPRRLALGPGALLLALVVAGPAFTGCAAATARLKSTVSGQPGMIAMPNLFRMSKAKALATLKLAGHTGDVSYSDQLCGSVIEGQIVEKDEVCRQTPLAGAEVSDRSHVNLLLQPEDPRHGKVGQTGEWHLMPEVLGMTVADAKAAMRAAGFTDERTEISEATEAGCKPGRVCKSYPVALERFGQSSGRVLWVGVDPNAKPVAPKPEPRPEPGEAKPPEPPPAPKPPDSYF